MRFHVTPIQGLWEVQSTPVGDARGALTRLYCAEEFERVAPGLRFVQLNHTLTRRRGSVRGLHVQRAPALECKLVRCLRGRVFDVAVDLRHASPTFGRWHALELCADASRQVLIPAGCAHGFQTLVDDTEMLYQHSAAYAPQHEMGVRYDDPHLGIAWPLPVADISQRDLGHDLIESGFEGLRL
jgi:dTDP-4-dehydrorhamnose 3,5-epimerase